jgi:A/G-specific adenine glycosylase
MTGDGQQATAGSPEGAGAGAAIPADRDAVRRELLDWFEAEGRDLPWRGIDDPYRILVAEVMSQQTQLSRVVPAWEAFLDRWPTVADLAGGDRSDVVAFWSDQRLGYNNRARYLHDAADQVIDEYDGTFPTDLDALTDLMGVGPYTGRAVASFAFDAPEAVVDTNVKRVLHRAFGVPDDDAAFRAAADALISPDRPGDWNDAMMDLGAMVCEPTPDCEACPWRERCHAHATGDYTAPDVPTQPAFEGSRRQKRGRVLAALRDGPAALEDLGPRVRVDYDPGSEEDREWLGGLLGDLADDGLVTVEDGVARLRD